MAIGHAHKCVSIYVHRLSLLYCYSKFCNIFLGVFVMYLNKYGYDYFMRIANCIDLNAVFVVCSFIIMVK